MLVITNMTKAPFPIGDGVLINPGEQLSVGHLTPEMKSAHKAGTLRVLSGDETLEERKADVKAIEDGVEAMRKITGD